jgi:hypothetical protein
MPARPRAARHPQPIRRTARRAATAAAVLLAALASAGSQGQSTPDRARTLAAIEAYRNVGQKFEQSTGPFKDWAGFYSRGYRCEFNETTAARPPGVWEKIQLALWTDDNYLYGMTLDASPAVFQFAYKHAQTVIGIDIYQLTRVDTLGAAAGIDDAEWRWLGIGVPGADDSSRMGIRITPEWFAYPDVHTIGVMTPCGRGGTGMDPILDPDNPVNFSIRFLQKRLATLPTPR